MMPERITSGDTLGVKYTQLYILHLTRARSKKNQGEGYPPLRSPDVVEHPVPHDQEAGDDHRGKQCSTQRPYPPVQSPKELFRPRIRRVQKYVVNGHQILI